jgi:hypothetical protein
MKEIRNASANFLPIAPYRISSTLLAVPLRTATIVSVRQEVRGQTQELFHNTMLDSGAIVTTTTVYQFSIRSGNNLYLSEYVASDNKPNLRKQWKPQVLIRVGGDRLYIRRDDGTDLQIHIAMHSGLSVTRNARTPVSHQCVVTEVRQRS